MLNKLHKSGLVHGNLKPSNIFIDGNKRNFAPNNLRVVSNAEMMKINTMLRFPLELQNTLRAIKKLQRTIENA